MIGFPVVLLILGLPAPAQSQYTADGTPTALEEEIRWRLNRGRFDTAAENAFRATNYTGLAATMGPVAPNERITLAARRHSEDMAKNNLMQHDTVPGSAYYNPVTQPKFWDRLTAEGYNWTTVGENVAAGYVNAEAVYSGWWRSEGHRNNMYNPDFREIGDGYYYWASAFYRHYYTMDLGQAGSACFFTDTLFADANTNNVYDAGEGIPGVAVRLMANGSLHGFFDLSAAVGSFAVPIQTITNGHIVSVVLSNTTAVSLALSIPTNYHHLHRFTLAPGQSRTFGTFVKTNANLNVGFRNVAPSPPPVLPNTWVNLGVGRSGPLLNWNSQMEVSYLPQWSSNLVVWNDLTDTPLAGTGSALTFPVATNLPLRFFRLQISTP